MISVDGLAVEFGGTTLFSDISFVINEKDRIALMGKNGAGKSTLLKILAGVRQPTRGKVSAPKDCVVAYLPQHLMTEDGRTVFDETAQAFAHLHEMEAQIDRLNKELETRTDYESDSYMALIEEVSALSEKFYSIDATNYEEDVEKSLLGLGFTREDFQRQTSDFSGGWRMRIELAKLLLQKPDVLLLDEPTNHMDMRSKDILKNALLKYDGTLVVVSHDREFLDGLVDKVYEFRDGGVKEYLGGIWYFLEKRRVESMREIEARQPAASAPAAAKPEKKKVDYQQKKELERTIRKTQGAVVAVEQRITGLEAEVAEWDKRLADPAAHGIDLSDGSVFGEYNALKERLAYEVHEWEKLGYELELLEDRLKEML